MPNAPRRHCTYPGCATLVLSGRCHRHRPKATRREPTSRRYGKDWRNIRAKYIAAQPRCEIQKRCNGAPAAHVDHKVPLANGGSNDWSNLQSACLRCHSWKTATHDRRRETDGRFA